MNAWNPDRDNVGAPRRKIVSRALAEAEQGEIRAFLAEHQVDEDAITELMDAAELHGEATSVRWGASLFLTAGGWGGDVFPAIRPEESADGESAAMEAAG